MDPRKTHEQIVIGGKVWFASRKAAEAVRLVLAELDAACELHAPMNSPLEGWAVIHEEEVELFDAIRGNQPPKRIRDEAVQVGAMALRFLVDLGLVSEAEVIGPEAPKGRDSAPVTAVFGDPIEVRDDDGKLAELIPQGVTLDANSPEDAARLSAALFVAADHPDEMAKWLGVEGVSP